MKACTLVLSVCAGLTILLAGRAASAAPGDDDLERCHAQNSTVEIVDCLDGFTKEWGRKLNTAYKQALAAADTEAGQGPQLKAAERAWLSFRQQNCAYYASVSGTIRQVLGADCMAHMTRDRAVELQEAIRP